MARECAPNVLGKLQDCTQLHKLDSGSQMKQAEKFLLLRIKLTETRQFCPSAVGPRCNL